MRNASPKARLIWDKEWEAGEKGKSAGKWVWNTELTLCNANEWPYLISTAFTELFSGSHSSEIRSYLYNKNSIIFQGILKLRIWLLVLRLGKIIYQYNMLDIIIDWNNKFCHDFSVHKVHTNYLWVKKIQLSLLCYSASTYWFPLPCFLFYINPTANALPTKLWQPTPPLPQRSRKTLH